MHLPGVLGAVEDGGKEEERVGWFIFSLREGVRECKGENEKPLR